MPDVGRPNRGSLAYSPRKRAKSHIPKFKSWPSLDGNPKLQDFAGYKVGMTHVIMIDDTKNSVTEGAEISVPATVVETPDIGVASIRAYGELGYGIKPTAEAWSTDLDSDVLRRIQSPENHDTEKSLEKIESLIDDGTVKELRVVTYTLPAKLTGVPKKKSDMMETGISGGSLKEKFEYAKSILGTKVGISDVFGPGGIVDIAAITTGKGTQGPVKRWGIQIAKHKHKRAGSARQVGTLGPWHPAHISWRVPQMGQMGYHQRTEYNKRIIKISDDGSEVNPDGGFLNYGVVRGNYVLIKGSVPGPSKRLVRFRDPMRSKISSTKEPQIVHVNTQSNQG